MLYSDTVETPNVIQTKVAVGNWVKWAAFGCWVCGSDPCPVLAWFILKYLILRVEEANPVEQVSPAARGTRPKSITVSVSISLSHIYTTTYLGKAHFALFHKPRAKARSEKKERDRVPSRVDSCDSSICGYEPGHYPIPAHMEANSQSNIKVNHTHD